MKRPTARPALLAHGLLLCLLWGFAATTYASATGCIGCHGKLRAGFQEAHAAFAQDCTLCHAGNASENTQAGAHQGLIAYPGDMDSAPQVCGACHADKVAGVSHSLMHTGAGMIASTRAAFGEATHRAGHDDLSHLTDSPADSLLKKHCASCHLGQPKTAHRLDATHDRGGGCLACHINDQSGTSHPALSAQVSDARCFGCHARSGRISLSYAGLAEVGDGGDGMQVGHLQDGRRVAFIGDDTHHAAGMGCTDCHTERGLMGVGVKTPPTSKRAAVDIRCADCHQITHTIKRSQWPAAFAPLQQRIPFPSDADTRFATTANGTPLWNIELRPDHPARLYRKDGQGTLDIPAFTAASHPLAAQHTRVDCSTCHANWAPQCYSCHLSYDAQDRQFDHTSKQVTAGRWHEQLGDIRNTLPLLGVDADGRIVPSVPGMVMNIAYPDWKQPRFVRRFAALAPHTTGKARNCASCHGSSMALGLGSGKLEKHGSQWIFHPSMDALSDGLPADAWTKLGATPQESSGLRPLSDPEIQRMLAAPLLPDRKPGPP